MKMKLKMKIIKKIKLEVGINITYMNKDEDARCRQRISTNEERDVEATKRNCNK